MSMRVGRILTACVIAALVLAFAMAASSPVKAPVRAASKPGTRPEIPAEVRAARAMVKRMTLADQIAQLIVVVCYGDVYSTKSPEYARYKRLVHDVHIGGLIVNNTSQYGLVRYAEPHALAVFLNQMQRLAKTPLVVASDFERGASMRVSGSARFPYAMAFGAAGDIDAAKFEGLTAAREARSVGVHWILAPVSDVNYDPDNPVINLRSYGEDPEQVARMVGAFIDGAHSDPYNRVLVTAKHFPGHGGTFVNSHLDLPRLDATREHMDTVELKPFQSAIAHGVDSIMTAHMMVPALESEDLPATVSPAMLRGLLRDQLKFQDLIVTDAMDMQGLTKYFNAADAAVRALAAGADVLLMPPDPEGAIRAVVAAVNSKKIPRQRIEESATRVMASKIRVGLLKKKLVDLDYVSDVLDAPEALDRAQQVSDRAVTLVKNQDDLLPLAANSQPCIVVMREVRTSTTGLRMAQEIQKRSPGARLVVVDAPLPLAALEATMGDTSTCSSLIVESSVTGSDSRTSVTLGGNLSAFVEHLTDGPVPVVLVSLGSPYLLASFPKSAAYLATFSPTVPSELSAAKALFGEMPITGRLPVTIPGFAQVGDGFQLPARPRGN